MADNEYRSKSQESIQQLLHLSSLNNHACRSSPGSRPGNSIRNLMDTDDLRDHELRAKAV